MRPARTKHELRLPLLDQRRVVGARFVQHAATTMLVTIGLLIVIAAFASTMVTVRITVDGNGVLEPIRVVPVRPLEDGLIDRVFVHAGDTVGAGQVLLQLDSLDLATKLATLEAQQRELQVARAKLVAGDPLNRERQVEQRRLAEAHLLRVHAALRDGLAMNRVNNNVDSVLAHYVAGEKIWLDMMMADIRSAESEVRLAGAEEQRLTLGRYDIEATSAKLAQLRASIIGDRARLARLDVRAPVAGVVLTEQLEKLADRWSVQATRSLSSAISTHGVARSWSRKPTCITFMSVIR